MLNIELDQTMDGQQSATNDGDPNKNAVGSVTQFGPEIEITSGNKRDGSH
jgi:hypothetical protein